MRFSLSQTDFFGFNEPTILGCRSVRDTLQEMFLEVDKVVTLLKPNLG